MHSKKSVIRYVFILICLLVVVFLTVGCNEESTTTTEAALEPKKTVTTTVTKTPVPQATATPTVPACMSEGGAVERILIDSTELDTGIYALVYTPHCYDAEGSYPVLYLLHGQSMTDQFWYDLGVASIADKAILNGQAPFMIVMPYEERNYDPPADSKFGDAIITDVIPWIDNHYATCTDRSCRAIGGVSRGGGWAVHLVSHHFDLFGALGAHSFGLMPQDPWWLQEQLKTHDLSEFPRIYIDRGDKDYLYEGIEYFVNVLTANKIPFEYHIYPGIHEKAYWQAHVEEYMEFYMAGWK